MSGKQKSKRSKKDIVKWDQNLSEYPLFVPLKGSKRPIEVELRIGDNGYLKITSVDGVPGAFDADVLFAIAYIAQEHDLFKENTAVHFSFNEVAKILGLKTGFDRLKIKESLQRWFNTSIYLKELYRKEGKLVTQEVWLHPIQKLEMYSEEMRKDMHYRAKNRFKAKDYTWIKFEPMIVRSVLAGYAKIVDLKYFRELKNPFSKRLYLYLEKKLGNQLMFSISFKKLCEILPILSYKNSGEISKAMKTFKKAMLELNDRYEYILELVDNSKDKRSKDYIVVFRRRTKRLPESEEWVRVREFLVSKMKFLGFSTRDIDKLLVDSWENLARMIYYTTLKIKEGHVKDAKRYFKKVLDEFILSNQATFEISDDAKNRLFTEASKVWRSLKEEQKEEFKRKFSGIFENRDDKPFLFRMFLIDWVAKENVKQEKDKKNANDTTMSRDELKESFINNVRNLMSLGFTLDEAVEKIVSMDRDFEKVKSEAIKELRA